MSVVAVELGASRLLAPYFSSSQIVWTIIIGTIMIAMALRQYLWWKKCGQVTKCGQIVWKDHDPSDNLDCTDSSCRKIHCTWNLCTAHFYGEQ